MLGGSPQIPRDGTHLLLEKEIRKLRSEVTKCQEEIAAIQECLIDEAVVKPAEFLIKVHVRRFRDVVARYGFKSDVRLETLVSIPGVALATGLCAGTVAMRNAAASCRAVRWAAGENILLALTEWVPKNIYVCGGHNDQQRLRTVERLNTESGTWEALPPMMHRRHGAAAGILRGKPYVCGGRDGQHLFCSVECYDPSKKSWEVAPSMLTGRAYAAAGSLFGKLYICGGSDTGMVGFRTAECFNPIAGRWEALPQMLELRQYPAASTMRGVLYLCGGSAGLMHPAQNSAERFDPKTFQWQVAPSMVERRRGAAAATACGKLFVCGGTHAGALASAEQLGPNSHAWEALPSMSNARHCAVAAAAGGYLYIFGGSSGNGQFLKCVERYDPAVGTWQSQASMTENRGNAVAVAVPRRQCCGGGGATVKYM